MSLEIRPVGTPDFFLVARVKGNTVSESPVRIAFRVTSVDQFMGTARIEGGFEIFDAHGALLAHIAAPHSFNVGDSITMTLPFEL